MQIIVLQGDSGGPLMIKTTEDITVLIGKLIICFLDKKITAAFFL